MFSSSKKTTQAAVVAAAEAHHDLMRSLVTQTYDDLKDQMKTSKGFGNGIHKFNIVGIKTETCQIGTARTVKYRRVFVSSSSYGIGDYQHVGWVIREGATNCMLCGADFGFMVYHHNCSACGNIVCHTCRNESAQVQCYGDELKKVCKQCYWEQDVVMFHIPEKLRHMIADYNSEDEKVEEDDNDENLNENNKKRKENINRNSNNNSCSGNSHGGGEISLLGGGSTEAASKEPSLASESGDKSVGAMINRILLQFTQSPPPSMFSPVKCINSKGIVKDTREDGAACDEEYVSEYASDEADTESEVGSVFSCLPTSSVSAEKRRIGRVVGYDSDPEPLLDVTLTEEMITGSLVSDEALSVLAPASQEEIRKFYKMYKKQKDEAIGEYFNVMQFSIIWRLITGEKGNLYKEMEMFNSFDAGGKGYMTQEDFVAGWLSSMEEKKEIHLKKIRFLTSDVSAVVCSPINIRGPLRDDLVKPAPGLCPPFTIDMDCAFDLQD